MPRSEARRREPGIPGARKSPRRPISSARKTATSVARFARSMTTPCVKPFPTISSTSSASSASACRARARRNERSASDLRGLPTAAKLLLILTAVLLPIGIALTWLGESGIRAGQWSAEGPHARSSRAAAEAIESLIARNALALRVAANEAWPSAPAMLAIGWRERSPSRRRWPKISRSRIATASPCVRRATSATQGVLPLVAPGDIQVRIAPAPDAVAIRAGVVGGMATALIAHTSFARPPLEAAG